MKKIAGILAALILLSGCGSKSVPSAQESFISGNGAVTFINKSDRLAAPRISGKTLMGTNFLAKRGAVTVVNVWASWCAPCRAEEPTLSALAMNHPNVQFVGILTRDNPVNAEAFVRKRGTPYPTLIDDAILLGFRKSLPANAIPSTVVIDKKGFVAGRISGAVTVASLTELIEKVARDE